MKVVVPFAVSDSTWTLAAVRMALRQDGIEAQYVQMRENQDYHKLLRALWGEKETFVVVEHDVVCWPGAIQRLVNCRESWCTLPYYCSVGWITDGLGCTKFSGSLQRKYPEFLSAPYPSCCAHSVAYCGLDRTIAHRFEQLGIEPHVHSPGVVNLNSRWT